MTSSEVNCATVVEWKIKILEFSDQSDDNLAPTISKVFDLASIMMKNSDSYQIQRALESLDSQRVICLKFEKFKEPSIRSLTLGLIESFHITLLHLMGEKEETYEKAESTIKEWKKKFQSFEFSIHSLDSLVSLIPRLFVAMNLIVNNADLCYIRRALRTLDSQRSQIFSDAKFHWETSIHSLMYGVIELIHLTLSHLAEKRNQSKSPEEGTNEEEDREKGGEMESLGENTGIGGAKMFLWRTASYSVLNTLLLQKEPKDESIDDHLFDDDQASIRLKFDLNSNGGEFESKDESMLNGYMGNDLGYRDSMADDVIDSGEEKEEVVHTTANTPMYSFENACLDGDQLKSIEEPVLNEDLDYNVDRQGAIYMDNHGMDNGDSGDCDPNETSDCDPNNPKGFSDTAVVEKRGRSSRIISGSVKYNATMKDSYEEMKPTVKKTKLKLVETKKRRPSKGGSRSQTVKIVNKRKDIVKKNILKCPECEYRCGSAISWWKHLKEKHSTTPTLTGYILRCVCGHESYSYRHSQECEISNFTVIRKGGGLIRRVADQVVTPQCVLCKKYPKTPCGYADHLKRYHKTSLMANGIFLICSCGMRFNVHNDQKKHDKKCSGHYFTLHRLDKTSPKCVMCEKYPMTPCEYTEHLKIHHKTTLQANGLYLTCSCGLRFNYGSDQRKHDKKCSGDKFTLHKLEED